jgi:Mrp family chromosome partitioning ATPase
MKQKQKAISQAYQEQQQQAQWAQQQYYHNMRQEQMRHLQDQRLNVILTSMAQSSATAAAASINIANAMDKKNEKKERAFKLLEEQ